MSPEFFEGHLINSGWSAAEYGDIEADTWNTRGAIKDYTSINWYRPVQPVERRDISSDLSLPLASRALLLASPGLASPKPVSRLSVHRDKFPQIQTNWISTVNIMRRDWDLGPHADPSGLGRRFSAWEERVTIWHKQLDGCVLAVLILDPFPEIQERVSTITILKASEEVPSATHASRSNSTSGPNDTKTQMTSSTAEAVSSSLSINVPLGNVKNSLLARAITKDPDPERGEDGTERENRGAIQRMVAIDQRFLAGVPRWMARFSTEATDMKGRSDISNESVIEGPHPRRVQRAHTKTTSTEVANHHAFQGLALRLPLPIYNCITRLDYQSQLSNEMATATSTRMTLTQALRSDTEHHAARRLKPMTVLFMIVQNDTMHILNLMDSTLTEIGNNISEDSLVQRNVDRWRRLLNRYEADLRHMEGSLHAFAESLRSIANADLTSTVAEIEHSTVRKLLAQLDQRILSVRRRTESADKWLLTTMSLVESKRSIAEAENITKLTEMAFFFIPLTFAATVFSMQVKELNASVTPISTFVILAASITIGSYALRLAMHNAWIWKRMRFMHYRSISAGDERD